MGVIMITNNSENKPESASLEIVKILEDMHNTAKQEYDALEMSLLRDIKQIECYAINKCLKRVKEFADGKSSSESVKHE